MGRPNYVCATCSEHFTRKYSAQRHNQYLHNGMGDIVRLIDYLAGRSSGQYTPNNPFWFKRNNPYHDIGSLTVADSVGDSFQLRYIPQQAPLGTSQYYTSPIYQPQPTIDEQRYRSGLSQETKLRELKRLVYQHSQYFRNPDAIIGCVTRYSILGDNTLLDEWLERFHGIDAISKH